MRIDRSPTPLRHTRTGVAAAALGAALALAVPATAPAATIAGLAATLLGANSPDLLEDTATRKRVRDSQLDVTTSSATSFTTRYALVVGADVSTAGTTTVSHNARYRISFTVNASAGEAWQLVIGTARSGALTLVDDGTGSALARLGAVTASRSGAGTLAGALGLPALPNLQGGTHADRVVSQTASAILSGVGTGAAQSVVLDFSFSASARSTRSGSNGDEAAVRLGLDSGLSGFTADDYPGPGARSLAGDGHRVTVTVVPEPDAWLLLAAGMGGLAMWSRRQRQRGASAVPAR